MLQTTYFHTCLHIATGANRGRQCGDVTLTCHLHTFKE